jgi:hypothetical protein
MDERPDQIEQHIQSQRDELGDNINELERKVKNAFDWRAQFDERPWAMLGLAFTGGLLISTVLPRRSSITSRVNSRRRSFSDPWSPYVRGEAAKSGETAGATSATPDYSSGYSTPPSAPRPSSETWDNLRNAAIALATTRLAEFVEELVPGFTEHYKKAASGKPSTAFTDLSPSTNKSWQKPNGGTDYGSHS